ncbi:3-oxoacyl-[acyl-carrier-protein] synthase III [Prauserella shujinwangii]|uniref:3-oxoacyl-[acyl-carrier-protein] synthase III n=1 Tax=Prauserella shujinwangii TaxID=1453103 RepID=A0A2T0M0G8_9PSEU|nr:beta-ketoacyl-ACP synthase III [Prauserella shujinwangii]PRX50094.1 3-oxoacyl-[acyl-carrier-protein] synthase III [Prauserella shujinwangii]
MSIGILGTGSYLPPAVLSSIELGERLGVGEEWIVRRTKIRERRVAGPDEATSDLAARAAEFALASAGLCPLDIDLIVVATSTPDQPIPATASMVQAQLGAFQAAAYDVDAVCTGFLYALVSTHALLQARPTPARALVIGADIYSRILDYDDRRTCVLFGDGAGAVVLGPVNPGSGLLSSVLASDGTMADYVQIPAGGSRTPTSVTTVKSRQHYFTMRGREVRELATKVLPRTADEVSAAIGVNVTDIDLLVPHQANGVLLDELSQALDMDGERMHRTVERYGNTGAASVPITLDEAVRHGKLHSDDLVLLLAIGGGMTWGGVALRWSRTANLDAA